MLLGRKFDNSAEVMAAIDMQGTWRQVKQLVEGLVREVKVCRHEQDESLELYERMLNDILCEKNQADMAHQEASRASAASSSWAEALSKRLTRTRTFHAWRHHTSVKIRRVQLATSSRVARHHARLGCFSWWRASVESSRAQRRLTRSWSGLLALRAWRELLERKRGLRERSRRELEQRRIRKMLDVWREEVVLERHVLGLEQGRVERKVRKLLTSWKLLLIMRRAKSLVLHKLTRDLYESSRTLCFMRWHAQANRARLTRHRERTCRRRCDHRRLKLLLRAWRTWTERERKSSQLTPDRHVLGKVLEQVHQLIVSNSDILQEISQPPATADSLHVNEAQERTETGSGLGKLTRSNSTQTSSRRLLLRLSGARAYMDEYTIDEPGGADGESQRLVVIRRHKRRQQDLLLLLLLLAWRASASSTKLVIASKHALALPPLRSSFLLWRSRRSAALMAYRCFHHLSRRLRCRLRCERMGHLYRREQERHRRQVTHLYLSWSLMSWRLPQSSGRQQLVC